MQPRRVWIRIENLPDQWIEELKRHEARAEFWHGQEEDADPDWLATAEVMFTDAKVTDDLLGRLSGLKWVQFTRGTAYELIDPALRHGDIGASVIPAMDGVQFAEFALGSVLLLAKQFPYFFRAQLESSWQRTMPLEIAGMTLGVLGLGTIGSAVARRAKAFDMRVLGLKKLPAPKPDFVDELWTSDRLKDLLRQADFLVITLRRLRLCLVCSAQRNLNR